MVGRTGDVVLRGDEDRRRRTGVAGARVRPARNPPVSPVSVARRKHATTGEDGDGDRRPRRTGIEEPLDAPLTVALVGIADLERRPAARRPEPVLLDGHLGTLPDHVPSGPDPREALELEPDPGRFRERAAERGRKTGRLERDEAGPDLPRAGGQPPEQPLVKRRPVGEIGDEDLDGTSAEQGPGEAQTLRRVGDAEHEEPLEIHAARYGLEWVEGTAEIEPRGDGATGLRLGNQPERERRLARRGVTAKRHLGVADESARAEDRVERREAGRDHAIIERRERVGCGRDADRQRGERALDGERGPGVARVAGSPPDGRVAGGVSAPEGSDRNPRIGTVPEPDRRAPPPRFEARQGDGERLDVVRRTGDGGSNGVGWAVHRPTDDRTCVLFVNAAGERHRRRNPPSATTSRGRESYSVDGRQAMAIASSPSIRRPASQSSGRVVDSWCASCTSQS